MSSAQRMAFIIQCFTVATLTTSSSMMTVMVPLYAVELGVPATWVGVLVALPSVFPMFMAMSAGRWIDGYGATRWFFIGMLGMTSAPLSLLLLPGVAALAIARLLSGFFQIFVTLASQSLVAGLDNGRSHQSNFAVYSTVMAVGRLVGPLLVGLIIDLQGFRASFLAVLAILALGALAADQLRRRTVREGGASAGHVEKGSTGQAFREVWGNVGLQLAVLTSAGVFLAITMRQAFLPILLQEQGWSATTIGALVSLGSLTAVLVRPIMPLVVRSFGGVARTLVATMVAVVIGVGALGLVSSLPAFAVLSVLAGFGTGVAFPLSIVTVASHVPKRHRGLALGVRMSSNHTVEVIAPVLGGMLIGAAGFGVGFAVAGGALALLTVLAVTRVRLFERTEPEEEAAPSEGG